MSEPEPKPESGLIGAVVVTYRPDHDVRERLEAMRAEADQFVVVDNGSPAAIQAELAAWCREHSGTALIDNPTNLGIAAALNQGARHLRAGGCHWLLCFDQDSMPVSGLARELRAAATERAAVLGPAIVEVEGSLHRWLAPHPWVPGGFRKRSLVAASAAPVTVVITSGSLLRLDCWSALGGFDEALFIDGVDTDYCLRAQAAGWQVLAVPGARLHHRLGDRRRGRLPGLLGRPTFHVPVRHYYIARNRWRLLRRHWRRGHWVAFEMAAALLNLVRVVLAEDDKGRKVRAMIEGTLDGLRGSSGVIPRARARRLERGAPSPR